MDTDSTFYGADQPLYNYRVLIPLVLEPERLFGLVDEGRNALPAVVRTPDEARFRVGLERCMRSVGVEALHHLRDLELVGGNDSVVSSFCEVARLPVERLHEPNLIIDYHGLLVGQGECRASVADLDSCGDERTA